MERFKKLETEMELIKHLTRIADALEKQIEFQEKAIKQNERMVEVQERILGMYGDAKRMAIERYEKDEKELKSLMNDPRYWKQQDPELVKKVEDGFKRLYG